MYAVYPKASEEHWSCFSPVWNPVAHKAFRVWQQAALVFASGRFFCSKQVSRWSGIRRYIVSSFIFSVMRGDNRDTIQCPLREPIAWEFKQQVLSTSLSLCGVQCSCIIDVLLHGDGFLTNPDPHRWRTGAILWHPTHPWTANGLLEHQSGCPCSGQTLRNLA